MLVLSLLSIFIGVFAKFVYRKMSNPITVFMLLWGGIFFLYYLRLVPYYDISVQGLIIFLLQMIGFAIGGFAAKRVAVSTNTRKDRQFDLNMPLVYIFCTITIATLLVNAVPVIMKLLEGMSLYEITHEGEIKEGGATGIMVLVNIFIVFPTAYGISALAAQDFLYGKKRVSILVLNIVIVLLYAFQHGGRHILIIFLCSYLFAIALKPKSEQRKLAKKEKKTKRNIILLCVLIVAVMVWLSISRGIEDLLLSLYKYFACVVPHFDTWRGVIENNQTYTWGFASIYGFISPFLILFQGAGLLSAVPGVFNTASKLIAAPEELSAIGDGISTNAFVGASYTLYADGRYFGVLLGMLLFGYICTRLYITARQSYSSRTISVYLLFMTVLIMTFTKNHLCQYFYAMALLMIRFVFYKEAVKK